MEYVKQYFEALLSLTNEMAPYLLLGFIFAGILHVFFPEEKINRLLGASNFKSVFKAALIGIPLPLCSCGVIPTGVSFYKHGASKGSTVSFLISTPQTGVDSIMVTYSLIGLPFAILRVIVALITGLLGGITTNLFVKNNIEETSVKINTEEKKNHGLSGSIIEIFSYAFIDFIKDIAKWLIIGLLLAALITVLVPDDFFSTYLNSNILTMFIVLLASVPLYVCATGSVPIAAALIMKGISPGAALVFLMAGPATNAATITVIGKVMGKESLFAYLGSIIFGALLFGILTDLFIPADFLTRFMTSHHSHEHEMLPKWLMIGSSIVLTIFLMRSILLDIYKKYFKKKTNINIEPLKLDSSMKQITLSVKGMNCNHCKMNVENGLKQFSEIKTVDANVEQEYVTLEGDQIDLEKVKSTIESLGYKYGGELFNI